MKWFTFMLVVAVAALEAACHSAAVAPPPEYRAFAPAISSRCKPGQLLQAENLESFPIYYTLVTQPERSGDWPAAQDRLGNTGPLQTDTLVEVNAAVRRVIAWPDLAHRLGGPWDHANRPNVRFTCVNA